MTTERSICPHCGSGDVESLLVPPRASDVFADVPAAHRRCLVCGVSWEIDDIELDAHTA